VWSFVYYAPFAVNVGVELDIFFTSFNRVIFKVSTIPASSFTLSDQVIFLTGACGGLGRAMAELFAEQGASLVLTDRDQAGCEALASDLSHFSGELLPLAVDLSDKSAVEASAKQALDRFGRVDALVCSAGVEGHVGALTEADDASWNSVMTINLQANLWLSQCFAPAMKVQGSGRMVFLASIAGLRGNRAIGLYGMSKAALSQMARNLAIELGPSGISVNCIAPGLIETPLSAGMMANEAFMERRMAMTPSRRVGQPSEVAGLALYLVSKLGGFVNGQTLVIDGGTVITDGS